MITALIALAIAATPPHELEISPVRDGIITGVATAFVIGTELAKSDLAPSTCRWCSDNAIDRWGRGAKWSNTHAADVASSAIDLALPVGLVAADWAMAHQYGYRTFGEDTLIFAEAVSLDLAVNQLVKYSAGRQRPYAHDLPAGASTSTDDNLSFFSGHTSLAFTAVAVTGTIAELRGYENAKWIWIIGAPVAATVGYLRMAADKHWLTDVVTGALVGAGIGAGVPLLLHGRKQAPLSLSVGSTGQGPVFALSGTW
jgi:membrane-associated phospholipid phosphatase